MSTTTATRQVVLLTGASSGLGLAIARQLLALDAYHLVLTCRASSLHRFAEAGVAPGPHVWLRAMDIVDYGQLGAVVAEIDARLGGVHILINNAGISDRSTVEESGDATRHRQIDVNYLAPLELISRVLPTMRRRRAGRILNVSSAGGFMAMPTMSAYSASKFALEAASEALWYEVRPWGVHVTLVVPGFINSDGYLNVTEHPGARNERGVYFEHYRGMRELVAAGMQHVSATNQSVAAQVAELLRAEHPPLRAHLTLESRLFFWFRKLVPARLYHWVLYLLLPNVRSWGARAAGRPFSAAQPAGC